MSEGTGQATRAELANNLRGHYDQLSRSACDWHSAMPKAIDAWEREPDLRDLAKRLAEALVDYDRHGCITRPAHAIAALQAARAAGLLPEDTDDDRP